MPIFTSFSKTEPKTSSETGTGTGIETESAEEIRFETLKLRSAAANVVFARGL